MNLFGGVEEKMAKIEKNYENLENYNSFVCCLLSYDIEIAYSIEKRILHFARIYKMRIKLYSNFLLKNNIKIKNIPRNNNFF